MSTFVFLIFLTLMAIAVILYMGFGFITEGLYEVAEALRALKSDKERNGESNEQKVQKD